VLYKMIPIALQWKCGANGISEWGECDDSLYDR
jgi:hypothetical protein